MFGNHGERDAGFADYVTARRPQLYRTAYLLCGDRHRAEDLVQTALTKLYVAWERAGREGSLDAYARRTLVNAHIDELRRPWRHEHVVGTVPDVPTQGPGGDDGDALWRAVRGLAPGQRRVVVLRHYWGLSVEETASDLGISPGTVKSQSSDALARLRSALASAGTGERT